MDKETREFLVEKFTTFDQRFDAIDQRFDGVDQRFSGIDEQFEETKRYFGVVAEGLQSELRQVAEGQQLIMDGQTRIIERVGQVERELGAMIKFSYAELEGRIAVTEREITSLKRRMDCLERAE